MSKKALALHVICWVIFIMMPLFISYINGRAMDAPHFLWMLPEFALLMLLFYTNYCLLIDKLYLKKKVLGFIAVNIVLIAFLLFVTHLYVVGFVFNGEPMPRERGPIPPMLLHQCTTYIFFVALSVVLKLSYNAHLKDMEIQRFEKEKAAAELSNLKSQLNPHFLFNSLNSIYALAAIDAEKTQQAIHNLSGLLRYMLYESNQNTVPLSHEIDFIKSYVETMRTRYANTISIRESYSISDENTAIAPLLFIALIENAFKHGIDVQEESFIDIEISENGKQLTCNILNSNYPKSTADKSGSGIGLDNLRRRLAQLYPNTHTFKTYVENKVFHAELTITLL